MRRIINELARPTNYDLVYLTTCSRGGRPGRVRVRAVGRRPDFGAEGDSLGNDRERRRGGDRDAAVGGGSYRSAAVPCCERCFFEVGEGVGCAIGATIDGEDHAFAAVAVGGAGSLRTIDPNGIRLLCLLCESTVRGVDNREAYVVNCDCEGWGCVPSCDWLAIYFLG